MAARWRGLLLADDMIRQQPAGRIDVLRSHWVMWREDRALDAITVAEPVSHPRCVIIDRSFPNPSVDSGSERILRVAMLIAGLDWEVAVLSLTGRKAAQIPATLELGTIAPQRSWDADDFATLVRSADVVILSRPQVAARLGPIVGRLTDGLVVYDTVDLHYVRFQREANTTGRWRPRLRSTVFRSLETSLAASLDCTVVVSPDERADLLARGSSVDVVVIPNIHPSRATPPPGPELRRHLIFVGSFKHGPNVDAVAFLVDEVMPLVRAADPNIRLRVVGRDLPTRLQDALGDDYLGWVDDLDPLLDASLAMLAPLRFGAGVKGKVGRALAAGLPVVTTSVGAEGLGLDDGRDALIRETPRGLAEACVELGT